MSGDTEGGRPGPQESPKRPRVLRRPLVGWPPPLRDLKRLLYQVYLAAGAPSLDEITGEVAASNLAGAPSRDTIHRVLTDGDRPQQQADVVAVATVLARRAAWDAPDLTARVRELWVQAGMAQGAGRPIGDFRGDMRLVLDGGLGIHPALDTDGARDRFGVLPGYVLRNHDARLKTVVDAAKGGRSGIAVLVGRSSTGKSRALWEAVSGLPGTWRLWHPLSPEAALATLQDVAPRTVVWLNETQDYLDPDPLGRQVAAGLRELLNDPSRAPVLVLGTLWPGHWDALTTNPERHAGAHALLGGHKIDVPDAFIPADLEALDTSDPRLAAASQHAKGARITQYLAGVPSLMERYDAARGATLALIHAAMDARRLGAGPHLPLDWLADAAPGYLDEGDYQALDRHWLTEALAYVTKSVHGIPGILTLVTTDGPRNQRTRRPAVSGVPTDQAALHAQGPQYMLADYLEQHGLRHRAGDIPPIDFWKAATHHAHPSDLTTLGHAAQHRGLLRDAAQFYKRSTAHSEGNAAGLFLVLQFPESPIDHRPAQWVVTHLAVVQPALAATLLSFIRGMMTGEQIAALAERAAAHVLLDDREGLNFLLEAMREAGAAEQVTLLAERAAADVVVDDPSDVVMLLGGLGEAGASEQVTALLARDPASHVTLDHPRAIAALLGSLAEVGASEQVTALLARDPASHVTLDAPNDVAWLMEVLRELGVDEQVTTLLARDPAAHADLDSPYDVALLLEAFREVEADEQTAVLAERAAAHTDLASPDGVVLMLEALHKVGAGAQLTVLAERAATGAALDDPDSVAELLKALHKVGAGAQLTVLAERAATGAALDHPHHHHAALLEVLQTAGLSEQVTALLARDSAVQAFRVAQVLAVLWKTGVIEQVTAMAERAAADVLLDDPHGIAALLRVLRKAGANGQVTTLLAREPAIHVVLDHPDEVAALLKALRKAGADEQAAVLAERAATGVAITGQPSASQLMNELGKMGAEKQLATLTERLPAAGHFDEFLMSGGNSKRFRFGREPDGTAAAPWTWDDLD